MSYANGEDAGVAILRRTTEFTEHYETAAWYRTGKFEPQEVPLKMYLSEGKLRLAASFEGVVTSSYFGTLYGGVPIGKGGVDEDVGKLMKKGTGIGAFDLMINPNLLDPLAAEQDVLFKLNDAALERFAKFLPPQESETLEEAAVRVGTYGHGTREPLPVIRDDDFLFAPQKEAGAEMRRSFFFMDDDYYAVTKVRKNFGAAEDDLSVNERFVVSQFSNEALFELIKKFAEQNPEFSVVSIELVDQSLRLHQEVKLDGEHAGHAFVDIMPARPELHLPPCICRDLYDSRGQRIEESLTINSPEKDLAVNKACYAMAEPLRKLLSPMQGEGIFELPVIANAFSHPKMKYEAIVEAREEARAALELEKGGCRP